MMQQSASLQSARSRRGKAFAIALNRQITVCESPAAIFAIFQSRGHDFNHVNLATAITDSGGL